MDQGLPIPASPAPELNFSAQLGRARLVEEEAHPGQLPLQRTAWRWRAPLEEPPPGLKKASVSSPGPGDTFTPLAPRVWEQN